MGANRLEELCEKDFIRKDEKRYTYETLFNYKRIEKNDREMYDIFESEKDKDLLYRIDGILLFVNYGKIVYLESTHLTHSFDKRRYGEDAICNFERVYCGCGLPRFDSM